MTKVFLVRHCEAMGNVRRLFQGTSDFDISELGAKQLTFLTDRFKDVKIDKVYSSPLIRTQKTAKAIIGERDIEIVLDKGIMELNGGIYEGKPFGETFRAVPGLADIWDNHPEDFSPPEGEAMTNGYERIWEAVNRIARENKGKTVVCATHGGIVRCLNCRLLKNDIHELKNIPWSENTAVTLLEFDDDMNVELKYYNDTSHVPTEYINKKTRIASFLAEDNK